MFVCKDHQDQVVNIKGKGCTRCQSDLQAYRKRKQEKRDRRRGIVEEEEEDNG